MWLFFFSSRRRHTRYWRDWSSDVCSSDLLGRLLLLPDDCGHERRGREGLLRLRAELRGRRAARPACPGCLEEPGLARGDRKRVVEGKSVDLGGRRIIKKKKTTRTKT